MIRDLVVCLGAAALMSCASAAEPRSPDFKAELSRAIEEMIRHNERLARAQANASQAELASFPQAGFSALLIPVWGVTADQLEPSFGDHRSGGRRHLGIDIFAPRGTAAVAATDGYVSFLGTRPLAGRCIWLQGRDGRSYFYAHLDAWTPGLWEGQRISVGQALGFVGNSGNASGTSPHLHFEIRQDGEAIDPYPLLTR